MNRKGDAIRNTGMTYVVVDIVWSPDSSIPTYILQRTFDSSFHYAKCSHIRPWTKLHRIEDKKHVNLSKNDVMMGMDEAFRRI